MKVIIVTGQTATGKTSYALQLAAQHDGELINCDSRQIYKELNIITGKDLTDTAFHFTKKIDTFDIGYYDISDDSRIFSTKVWLYDIVNPRQYFSSFDYQTCALDVITEILHRGKTPIIVGGTYFYLKHLLYDIPTQNIAPNWELRKELQNNHIEDLQQLLKKKSPEIFATLNNSDRNNPQRLIRKIEIADSGFKNTTLVNSHQIHLAKKIPNVNTDFSIEYIGLKNMDQKILHAKIENRVEKRLSEGAIQEVEQLLQKGYTESDPGICTIGYQQLIQYLNKSLTKEKAITEWKTKEKQYAKRQETFMKKDINIIWKQV